MQKGILICGSGVGASSRLASLKAPRLSGYDAFSAIRVEDDDMNLLCLGGGIVGLSLATDIINVFLKAEFKNEERFVRRLNKVKKIEEEN
jgi:ribose 5-phosphate isomerase B